MTCGITRPATTFCCSCSRSFGAPAWSTTASGTDHGAGSVAFVVGEHVKGGLYGTYPSLEPSEQEAGGNLKSLMDFRSVYTTIFGRLDASGPGAHSWR